MPETHVATISEIKDVAPDVRIYKFKFPVFDFIPGQFCMLGIQAGEKEERRAFSICSSPNNKEEMEFCIVRHDDGKFSVPLWEKSVGDEVTVIGPYGNFSMANPTPRRETIFVAGGTGIAPVISMIRTLDFENIKVPIHLYFGFRTSEFYLYKEELEALEKEQENFRLVTTISRDDDSWEGRRGYVYKHLEELKDNGNKDSYICGPPNLVVDVVKKLEEIGFAPENIYKEQW